VIGSVEQLHLRQAHGRIVAAPVTAPLNLPPFNASAMDGYALRYADFQRAPGASFRVVGQSLAGHPFAGDIGSGECVRVFTGAKLPEGADQVILQEECASATDDEVRFAPHAPGESYVRPIGHDVTAGTVIADRGERLDPFTLGALSAAGVAEVTVYDKPTVGIFSTGDELVDPGTPPERLAEGQIYDSNRFTVLSLLRHMPCSLLDLGRLADDPHEVERALAEATQRCSILITSGGVSVGEADYITATIQRLGELHFWRLNLKPGKPLAFGRIGECFIFGLPGNPVSTIVTLLMLAKPAIHHHAGARPGQPLKVSARLEGHLAHTPGRVEYQRGTLQVRDGIAYVAITGDQSSNRLRTFRHANCLVEVPQASADLAAGTAVMVLPFNGLLD